VDTRTEREALLRTLVAASVAVRPERERFRVQRLESHAGPLLLHSGFELLGETEPRTCNREDLEDLHAQGLIRLKKEKRSVQARGRLPRTYWEEWHFDVTDAGFEKVELEQRAAAESERIGQDGASVSYDWKTEGLPVLQAVSTASESADVDLGVSAKTINELLGRQPDDPRTDRILTMLVRGDYVGQTIRAMGSSGFFQVTEKGLQVTAGWPSGAPEATYTRLLELIDERLDEAVSEEERSRWQRLRDGVVGVGRDVAVDVLSAAAQTGLRHIP
jgi:hypothetical protein